MEICHGELVNHWDSRMINNLAAIWRRRVGPVWWRSTVLSLPSRDVQSVACPIQDLLDLLLIRSFTYGFQVECRLTSLAASTANYSTSPDTRRTQCSELLSVQ